MNERRMIVRGPQRLALLLVPAALAGSSLLVGCTQHRIMVDPIEVKPMHITVDVNLRVDRELDNFFDFEKPIEKKVLPEIQGNTPAPAPSDMPPPPMPMP